MLACIPGTYLSTSSVCARATYVQGMYPSFPVSKDLAIHQSPFLINTIKKVKYNKEITFKSNSKVYFCSKLCKPQASVGILDTRWSNVCAVLSQSLT